MPNFTTYWHSTSVFKCFRLTTQYLQVRSVLLLFIVSACDPGHCRVEISFVLVSCHQWHTFPSSLDSYWVHAVKQRIDWGSFAGPHSLCSRAHRVHTPCSSFLRWKRRFGQYDLGHVPHYLQGHLSLLEEVIPQALFIVLASTVYWGELTWAACKKSLTQEWSGRVVFVLNQWFRAIQNHLSSNHIDLSSCLKLVVQCSL